MDEVGGGDDSLELGALVSLLEAVWLLEVAVGLLVIGLLEVVVGSAGVVAGALVGWMGCLLPSSAFPADPAGPAPGAGSGTAVGGGGGPAGAAGASGGVGAGLDAWADSGTGNVRSTTPAHQARSFA